MANTYECIACFHQLRARIKPTFCDNCNRPETYSILERMLGKSKAISALDVDAKEPNRYSTGDSEFDSLLMGGLVRPCTVTAFGRGGTGKSRSCLRWATNLGKTLLVSLEMPLELAVYSAKSARANLAMLHAVESEESWKAEAQETEARAIVFDSFHYSQKQRVKPGSKVPFICFELAEWAKANDGIVFMICHSNKRNEVSGTTAVEHWPDYLLKFQKHGDSESKLTLPKSRYSQTGSCIITI